MKGPYSRYLKIKLSKVGYDYSKLPEQEEFFARVRDTIWGIRINMCVIIITIMWLLIERHVFGG